MTHRKRSSVAAAPRAAGHATFDPSGRYRYSLRRRWSPEGGRVVFVLLNPSTADASRDDPTIRRCRGFARDWGFGGMVVVNLFARRATHPRDLFRAEDPVGPANLRHLAAAARGAERIVAGWGHHGAHPSARAQSARVRRVLGRHGPVHCLGTTAGGEPRHPLYVSRDTPLRVWHPSAAKILSLLEARYPDARSALVHRSPWELLIATILSAQTTDATVNRVTGELFRRWPDPASLAGARLAQVEGVVHPTGFFRQKAHSIVEASRVLVERYGGQVPTDMDSLTRLRGVGRKTASVVLAEGFGLPALAVDTHVFRVSRRLGLAHGRDATAVERELRALYPPESWEALAIRLVRHGRDTCDARRPRCGECMLLAACPERGSAGEGSG